MIHDQPVKAAVIHINTLFKNKKYENIMLEEACNLLRNIGSPINITHTVIAKITRINPKTVLGKGKVIELQGILASLNIQLVFVNIRITAKQQRQLEQMWHCKILDRPSVILEVFAQRATSKTGKLQIVLAQCRYERSKLVRTWTHLERQKGGTSKLGGMGEKQLEMDKRMLDKKIKTTQREIQKIQNMVDLRTIRRLKQNILCIALVGYTSAGKSTLFNCLTQSNVTTDCKPFTTLDTTSRKLILPSGNEVRMTDTIGFIHNLPPQFFPDFKVTLDDAKNANIIIHVQDITAPDKEERSTTVLKILQEIGVDIENRYILNVYTKTDLLENTDTNTLTASNNNISSNSKEQTLVATTPKNSDSIHISSLTHYNIHVLLEKIEEITKNQQCNR